MRFLDLHDVGYGACAVLGGDRGGILMADCGSSNRKLGENGPGFYEYVTGGIVPRYRDAENRAFFLSHCHRDHLCGLWRILAASPSYFGRIFLPVPPRGEDGEPLLLDFALYVSVFLSRLTGYAKENVSVLELFSRAASLAGAGAVFPVRQGDRFGLDGTEFEVIWPPESGLRYPDPLRAAVGRLDETLSGPFPPPCAAEFLTLRDRFRTAYGACCASAPAREEDAAEAGALLARISALAPDLLLLPFAGEAAALLSARETREAYSEALNAACAVFQNVRAEGPGPDDILMTGDATPESLRAASGRMYDGYGIVQAPHHGAAGPCLALFGAVAADHILISSGRYRGGFEIAAQLAELPAVRHCSGSSACGYYRENGSCCNRLSLCASAPGGPSVGCGSALTVRCPGAGDARRLPPCRIRTVSYRGAGSCLCDVPPARGSP